MAYYLENHVPTIARPENGLHHHKVLSPFWASLKYKDVKKSTVQEYCTVRRKDFKKLRKREISNDTLRTELEHLYAAFNYAFEDEIVDRVPPTWKPPKPEGRDRWLTTKEVALLLREARKLKYAQTYLPLFILMAVYTGARSGAILSRRWSDIDLVNGYIDFGQSVGNKKRGKTRIPKHLLRELKRAKDSDVGYVINNYGERVTKILKSYKTAAKNAGLETTPHDLRRTFVSWMVQRGVDLFKISKWSGMSIKNIEQRYGHLAPKHFDQIMEAFG